MTFPVIPTVGNGRVIEAFQSASSNTRTFPTLNNLTKNSGDLLLAIIVAYESGATNAAFTSWTGGFTEVHDSSAIGIMAIGVAYKWSDGTENSTFQVTQNLPANPGAAQMIVLSIPGAHATTPPAVAGRASGTSTAATPGSLTTPTWDSEDTLWIAVGATGETGTGAAYTGISTTPPTDYGSQLNFAAGVALDAVGGVDVAVAFRQLNATTENPGNFGNDTSNARWGAITIGVRPAPALAQVTTTRSTTWFTGGPPGFDTPGNISATATGEPVEPEAHSHLPAEYVNGALYRGMESNVASSNRPQMMKSTDNGATWAGAATVSGTVSDLESVAQYVSGTTIHYLVHRGATAWWVPFDATTDTWGTHEVIDTGLSGTSHAQRISVAPLSNGTQWIFYSDSPSGSNQIIAYRQRTATNTYGTKVTSAFGPTSVSQTGAEAVVGASDVTHIVYTDNTNLRVYKRTLSSAGTLSAAVVVDDGAAGFDDVTGANDGEYYAATVNSHPVYYDDAGVEVISVLWSDPSGDLYLTQFRNGVKQTSQQITSTPVGFNPASTTHDSITAHLAADGTDLYIVWADATTGDVLWRKRSGNGTLGTVGTVFDSPTSDGGYYAYANIYTHSGTKYLGVAYDKGAHGNDVSYVDYNKMSLGAGLASVSTSRSTTWAVAAPVSTTRATTWTTKAGVSTSRATTWTVRVPVSTSRATTWAARATVAASRATTWVTKAVVSASRATTWGTRTAVAASRATTWTTRALVAASRATTWSVLTSAMTNRNTTWNVAGNLSQVGTSRGTTWTTRAVVTGTRATTWTVSTPVATTRNTTWTVRVPVSTVRSTTWNAAARVTASRSTTWAASTVVSTSRATTWAARVAVLSSRSTTWTTRALVSSSRLTSWTVRTPVSTTRATSWSALVAVMSNRNTTWNVTSTIVSVGTSRSTTWNLDGRVNTQRSTTWAARALVLSSRSTTWSVRSGVTTTRSTQWATLAVILGPGGHSVSSSTWAVLATVTKEQNTFWGIGGRISTTRSTTWAILGLTDPPFTPTRLRALVRILRAETVTTHNDEPGLRTLAARGEVQMEEVL